MGRNVPPHHTLNNAQKGVSILSGHQKKWIPFLSVSVVLVFLIVALTAGIVSAAKNDGIDRTQGSGAGYGVEAAKNASYWIELDEAQIMDSCDPTQMTIVDGEMEISSGAAYIAAGQSVKLSLCAPANGKYTVVLVYQTLGDVIVQSTITTYVDDLTVNSYINGVWCDESKIYQLDRYGNEVTPSQTKVDVFVKDYIRDCSTLDFEPIEFELSAGDHNIIIENDDQDILLQAVILAEVPETVHYSDYVKDYDGDTPSKLITIEGENYLAKSDSYIRTKSDINSSCYPYSSFHKLLNAVDYYSWQDAGQRVVWQFQVEQAGWYNICVHYTQSEKEGQSVYRNIEIDGKIPYEELKEVAFGYTGSDWENAVIKVDGENAKIYLTEGTHTISMLTSVPSLTKVIQEIQAISDELSDIGLDLQQVAGSNADANRTWEIETYIPGVTDHLRTLQQRLLDAYEELSRLSGTTAASCANLKQAAGVIEESLKRPDKLPTYVEQLSIGSGSATEMLATLVNEINQQGMSVDRIYLYGDSQKLPAADANFLQSIWHGIQRFVNSLMNREGSYGVTSDVEEDAITVWVNRPISYVETLQIMVDSTFTKETGIKVYFSVMPDESKLLLANASDTCPDVALGVSSDRPYQLGARGAALDLTQFDDFADYVLENFTADDLEPFVYDGSIYGIPETKNFYVLMYRSDILEKLNLSIPETWDDVASMMPVLRRSGMTFYMPLSSYTGTKALSAMAPFFLQSGASLYSDDGLSTMLNSENGIKAFTTVTDLYTLYGLQNNTSSFYNNFRYGTMPIGVASFSSYVEMLYAAPEIAGKWDIALTPGTLQEDGSISRVQVSVDRSDIIMKSSTKQEQAWSFLKWWMSEETQVDFAYTLQTKYGSEYVWNTANKNAFTQLAFPTAHKQIIMEQWEESANYRIMPATYMLERELSNAWYSVVNDKESARTALNSAVFTINQETTIRMKQFGYLDDTGAVIRNYDMRSAQEILDEVKKK